MQQVQRTVRPNGVVIVATFAEDGPTQYSGVPVERYSPAQLHDAFGDAVVVLESHREMHTTPSGATQAFTYCVGRAAPHVHPRAAP